jgi:thioredoxin reductase
MAVRLSENAAQLTSSVTIYTHGQEELGQQILAASGDGKKPKIDTRTIKAIRKSRTGPEVIIYFEKDNKTPEGSKTPEAFLVHTPTTQLKGTLAGQINLELSPEGEIKAEAPFYQTSMKGVFAAGDCVTPYKTTAGAISSGCSAALAVATQLQAEDAGHDSMV